MRVIRGDEPALPLCVPNGDNYVQPGMDIRTWLAGQALANVSDYAHPENEAVHRLIAESAVKIADATIAELAKPANPT